MLYAKLAGDWLSLAPPPERTNVKPINLLCTATRWLTQGDENSTAAIYGMASSMPAGPVNVLLRAYTDVTLGT